MRRLLHVVLMGVVLGSGPAWAGDVKVSFANGLVTIVATNATPREILAEWGRQGRVQIANLDRLAGAPVTLQMIDVPEAQALETLLRGTAGYLAAPRAAAVTAASNYDRILLMPGTAPATVPSGAAFASGAGGAAGRPRLPNFAVYDAGDGEDTGAVRQAAGRYDSSRDQGSSVTASPAFMAPSLGPYAPASNAQSSAGWQTSAAGAEAGRTPQAAIAGAATPGSFTPQPAPQVQRIQPTPYSNDGPPAFPVAGPTSSPVPGQIVGQPITTSGPVGAATGTPFQFQNPYGLPETVRVPVVNPSANPYGLTPPAATTPATTPPATTTPPAPIKKSGTDGGQDAA